MGESSSTDCASTVANDTLGVTDTADEPTRGLRLRDGAAVSFRLMFRRGMYDIYLDNALIQSYALPRGGVPYKAEQNVRLVGSWMVRSSHSIPLHVAEVHACSCFRCFLPTQALSNSNRPVILKIFGSLVCHTMRLNDACNLLTALNNLVGCRMRPSYKPGA